MGRVEEDTGDCPGLVHGAGVNSLAFLVEDCPLAMSQNGRLEDSSEYFSGVYLESFHDQKSPGNSARASANKCIAFAEAACVAPWSG